MKSGRQLRGQRGQSIFEYLVIVTVVIVAIIAIRGMVQVNMNSLFTNAAGQTATAAGKIEGTIPGD